jgi:hypothetical protein
MSRARAKQTPLVLARRRVHAFMSHRLPLAAACAAIALVVLTPAAAEAFSPTAITAAPADTQAGANTNFSVHFALDEPSHDLKSFVLHLPPGEVGAVTATPLCTQAQFAAKACPADTQVGTTVTHATAFPTPITGLAVDVPGKLYNLAPVGPEPARLGIRLTPSLGDEILLQSVVTVRPSDGGLDSTTDNLPRDSALGPIDIDAIDITLFGTAGDPAKGFISNPTSCAPATTTIDTIAYDGAQGSGSAAYTPTGCDKLAFAPTLSATIDPGAKGGHPTLTTVVESPPGQANARSVQITLPAGLSAVPTTLNHACPEATFAAGGCAANAQIGTAKAETPALAAPLEGPVVLVKPASSPLPELVIDLHGPIALRLPVAVGFGPGGRLQSTLAGLPDTALSRFTLTLSGGADGLLVNARDLCSGAGPRVDATFAGQNGATSTASVVAQVPCPAAASNGLRATATLTGVKHRRPALRLKVSAPSRVRELRVTLPKQLTSRKGVHRKGVSLKGRTLTFKLAKHGTRAANVRLTAGALRLAKKLKVGQRVSFAVTAVRVNGKKLSVRATTKTRA